MEYEPQLSTGLDEQLTQRIQALFIRDGRLFGALPEKSLEPEDIQKLRAVGWVERQYHDEPVMEAPQITIDWDALRLRHRTETLHALSHRYAPGTPWVGTRHEILEELLASEWESKMDELKTVLHAWAYASVWDLDGERPDTPIETRQTFFFYTAKMKESAHVAMDYVTQAPAAAEHFWQLVEALLADNSAP